MRKYIVNLCIVSALLLNACHAGHKHDHDHDHDHDHEVEHQHDGNCSHDEHDGGHADEHTGEIVFSKAQAEAAGLTTEKMTAGKFSEVIKTSGQILAAQGDEVTVVATSNGIVSFDNPAISDGTPVKAGQAIVSISAQKLLEGDPAVRAQIAYETAEKEFLRAEKLIQDNIISAKEYEQIRLRYETARTAYQAQAPNMTKNGVKVTSPISGYIKNRMVGQGEYVSVGQAIATVSQNRRLQLRADVPESYYKTLKNISTAHFMPAYDKTVYRLTDLNGRLLSFGKATDKQSFFLPVTFEFDNVGDILPGSFAEIYLLSGSLEQVISVPVSAVTEEQGLYFVYLQLGEEVFKKQEVSLGHNNGERVQVLTGLKEGDRVVTKGVYQVKLAATSSVIPEGHSHSH